MRVLTAALTPHAQFFDGFFYFELDSYSLRYATVRSSQTVRLRVLSDEAKKMLFLGQVDVSAASLALDEKVHMRATGNTKLCSVELQKRSRRSHVSGHISLNACVVDFAQALAAGDAEERQLVRRARTAGSLNSLPSPKALAAAALAAAGVESNNKVDGTPPKMEGLDETQPSSCSARIYINVAEARDLLAADATGKSDPYVRVYLNDMELRRTSTINTTLSPKWNETFMVDAPADLVNSTLKLAVYDEDYGFTDDFLGQVVLPLGRVKRINSANAHRLRAQWHLLNRDPRQPKKRATGELRFRAWIGDQDDELLNNTGVSVYQEPKMWMIRISLEEAAQLRPMDVGSGSDPYAVLTVGSEQRFQTIVRRNTLAPRWQQSFYVWVTDDLYDEQLSIVVHDYDALGTDEENGRYTATVRDFMSAFAGEGACGKNVEHLWLELKRPSRLLGKMLRRSTERPYAGLIKVSAESLPSARELSARQLAPIGMLRVDVLGAAIEQGLVRIPDCYCVVRVGQTWYRTPTVRDSAFPSFDLTITADISDPSEILHISLWDDNQLRVRNLKDVFVESLHKDDKFMGKFEIPINTLINNHAYRQTIKLYTAKGRSVKETGTLDVMLKLSIPDELAAYKRYKVPTKPLWSYFHPLSARQNEILEKNHEEVLASHLSSRAPPIRREVTQTMLAVGRRAFEVRRFQCHYARFKYAVEHLGVNDIINGVQTVMDWKYPWLSTAALVGWVFLMYHPGFMAPLALLFISYSVIRARGNRVASPFLQTTDENFLMGLNTTEGEESESDGEDEDETGDQETRTRNPIKIMRMKYASLISKAGKVQGKLEEAVELLEKLQGIWSWRDPKVSMIVVVVTVVLATLMWVLTTRFILSVAALVVMRHPKYKDPVPPAPKLIFDSLPSKSFLTL